MKNPQKAGNILIGVGALLVIVAMTPVPGALAAIPLAVVAFCVGIALALKKKGPKAER